VWPVVAFVLTCLFSLAAAAIAAMTRAAVAQLEVRLMKTLRKMQAEADDRYARDERVDRIEARVNALQAAPRGEAG